MLDRAENAVDPIRVLLDVVIELDCKQPCLISVRGVDAIFKSCVVRGSVTNRVWPAHGHEPTASDFSTMAHHRGHFATHFSDSTPGVNIRNEIQKQHRRLRPKNIKLHKFMIV